jgi:hypothetical protein
VDAAASRLAGLTSDGDAFDVWVLQAEILLAKGQVERARALLGRAAARRPHDSRLQRLWDVNARPAPSADALVSDLPLDRAIATVDGALAQGDAARATGWLAELAGRFPEDAQIADRQWVMAGAWRITDRSLADLAERWGPDIGDLAELPEEAEHTADTSDLAGQDLALPTPERSRFPHLFRGVNASEVDEEGGEHTQSMSMVDVSAERAPLELRDREEDTQVLRVVGRDGGESAPAALPPPLPPRPPSPPPEDRIKLSRPSAPLPPPPKTSERVVLSRPPAGTPMPAPSRMRDPDPPAASPAGAPVAAPEPPGAPTPAPSPRGAPGAASDGSASADLSGWWFALAVLAALSVAVLVVIAVAM